MSVERQTRLEAQRVAASETARRHPRGDELLPHCNDDIWRCVKFKTVLAGISCAARNYRVSLPFRFLESVESQVAEIHSQYLGGSLLCVGALQRNLSVARRGVVDFHIEILRLLANPGVVLVDVGGIHHQQPRFWLSHFVDKQVVDHAAVGIEHHSVENLSCWKGCDIVGEDVVDKPFGIVAGDEDLAHVRHVEHAHTLAHGIVLVND